MTAFSDENEQFEKRNAQVVAVSTDSKFSHLAWYNTPRSKGGIAEVITPILADFKKTTSHDYGVLLENSGVALRGLFIIDSEGILRYQVVHDLPIGRNVQEALRILDALQHSKGTGEVCPVNWSKGKEAINPAAASRYFEKIK